MVDSNLGLYRIAEEMDWGSPPSSLYNSGSDKGDEPDEDEDEDEHDELEWPHMIQEDEGDSDEGEGDTEDSIESC